jgi:hypothetical protein
VDDRAGRPGPLVAGAAAHALVLEARHDGGDSFLAVDRAAGEDDRVHARRSVAEAKGVCIDCAWRAATGIGDDGGAEHQADDGEAGRPLLIGADADLYVRPVEIERWPMDSGVGDEPILCAPGALSRMNGQKRSRRSRQSNASNRHTRPPLTCAKGGQSIAWHSVFVRSAAGSPGADFATPFI